MHTHTHTHTLVNAKLSLSHMQTHTKKPHTKCIRTDRKTGGSWLEWISMYGEEGIHHRVGYNVQALSHCFTNRLEI